MIRLEPEHRALLIRHLETNVAVNIFGLSVLERAGDRSETLTTEGSFYGVWDGADFGAVVFTTSGGLCVPFGPPEHALELGRALRGLTRPRLLVGPRAATDAFWEGLRSGLLPRIHRPHRLYSLTRGQLEIAPHPEVRRALARDLEGTVECAAQMQTEELGIDPRTVDEAAFRRRIGRLIVDGRFWVLPVGVQHGFQASASAYCAHGTQIEAVFTPPRLRGNGYAKAGLAGMCRDLLEETPLITLHVNSRNMPAVAIYQKLGFKPVEDFRLISC